MELGRAGACGRGDGGGGGGGGGGGDRGGGGDGGGGGGGRRSRGGDWITTTGLVGEGMDGASSLLGGGKGLSWTATGLVAGSGTGMAASGGGDGPFKKSSPAVSEQKCGMRRGGLIELLGTARSREQLHSIDPPKLSVKKSNTSSRSPPRALSNAESNSRSPSSHLLAIVRPIRVEKI